MKITKEMAMEYCRIKGIDPYRERFVDWQGLNPEWVYVQEHLEEQKTMFYFLMKIYKEEE